MMLLSTFYVSTVFCWNCYEQVNLKLQLSKIWRKGTTILHSTNVLWYNKNANPWFRSLRKCPCNSRDKKLMPTCIFNIEAKKKKRVTGKLKSQKTPTMNSKLGYPDGLQMVSSNKCIKHFQFKLMISLSPVITNPFPSKCSYSLQTTPTQFHPTKQVTESPFQILPLHHSCLIWCCFMFGITIYTFHCSHNPTQHIFSWYRIIK
jgi:hypothetical protein